MTTDVKNRKVKSIKLNPEKEVWFYNRYGKKLLTNFLWDDDLRAAVYWADTESAINSARLIDQAELTDYGQSEYEKGNILVEFEDSESECEHNYTYIGDDNGQIKAVFRECTKCGQREPEQPKRPRINDEGFKTELPNLRGDEMDVFFDIGKMPNINIMHFLLEAREDLNQLITALHERDQRIVELEERISRVQFINTSSLQDIIKLTDRLNQLETQLKELKEGGGEEC